MALSYRDRQTKGKTFLKQTTKKAIESEGFKLSEVLGNRGTRVDAFTPLVQAAKSYRIVGENSEEKNADFTGIKGLTFIVEIDGKRHNVGANRIMKTFVETSIEPVVTCSLSGDMLSKLSSARSNQLARKEKREKKQVKK